VFVAGVLNAAPAYVVEFRWTQPGSYPVGWRDAIELSLAPAWVGSPPRRLS
jgi:hypothetical protein